MSDTDPSFEDADAAAALYELAAPDLPPPTSMRREATNDLEIAVWAVQAKGGAMRMKVGAAEAAAVRLRRGAHVLSSLARRGVRVPEFVRVAEKPRGASVTVTFERRLGTANAAIGWPILGGPGRLVFAEALARALLELHAGSTAVGASDATSSGPLAWRDLVDGRVRRRVAFLREADVLSRASAERVEERMRQAAARLPEHLEPSLCHGSVGLASAALERRVFAGLQDFESACVADRWLDVAGALAALGDRAGGPARRFLEVYASVAALPADFATRCDLYGGLYLLRALSLAATAFPSEARAAAERLLDGSMEAHSSDHEPVSVDHPPGP